MATTCLKKDLQSGHFHKGANENGKRWGREGEVRMRLLLCQEKLVIYKTDKKKNFQPPPPPQPHKFQRNALVGRLHHPIMENLPPHL